GWWRSVSISDVPRIALGNFAGSLLSCVAILLIAPPGIPPAIYLLDLILSFLGTAGVRVAFRAATEVRSHTHDGSNRKNVLIYGAGDAGEILLRELRK